MRGPRCAIQNPLAAINAGDPAGDRHVKSAQKIASLVAGIMQGARALHIIGISCNAGQHVIRRRDVG
jgi:hypothetical protein